MKLNTSRDPPRTNAGQLGDSVPSDHVTANSDPALCAYYEIIRSLSYHGMIWIYLVCTIICIVLLLQGTHSNSVGVRIDFLGVPGTESSVTQFKRLIYHVGRVLLSMPIHPRATRYARSLFWCIDGDTHSYKCWWRGTRYHYTVVAVVYYTVYSRNCCTIVYLVFIVIDSGYQIVVSYQV